MSRGVPCPLFSKRSCRRISCRYSCLVVPHVHYSVDTPVDGCPVEIVVSWCPQATIQQTRLSKDVLWRWLSRGVPCPLFSSHACPMMSYRDSCLVVSHVHYSVDTPVDGCAVEIVVSWCPMSTIQWTNLSKHVLQR